MSLSVLAKLFDNIGQNSKVISFSESIHDLVDSLLHTSFSENGMKLKQVLEEHYRDGIDGFEDVQVEGDTITGIFLDRVSSGLTKKFRFECTPKNTVYSPINPDDTESFSELNFAGITKERNCVKGLSCGVSCVPMKTTDGKPTKCQQANSKAAEDLMNDLIVAAKGSQKSAKPTTERKMQGGSGNGDNLKAQLKKEEKEQPKKETDNVFEDIEEYQQKGRTKNIPQTGKQTKKPTQEIKKQESIESVDSIMASGLSISRSLGLKTVEATLDKEFLEVSKNHKNALAALKEYQRSKKKIPQALLKKGKELEARKKELQVQIDKVDEDNYKKIIGYLAKNSPVKLQEANAFVKNLKVDKSLNEQMQKTDTAKALRDFYLLSGGKVKTLEVIEKSSDRAFANETKKVINTGDGKILKKDANGNISGDYNSDYQRRIIFHEAAHHIEYSNPDIKKAAGEFIRLKATSQNPVKLKDLTGNPNYKDNEVALPDKFISPYVGKIYQKGTTEVISMGVEHFADPKSLAKLRREDPDHFNFILGILSKKNK